MTTATETTTVETTAAAAPGAQAHRIGADVDLDKALAENASLRRKNAELRELNKAQADEIATHTSNFEKLNGEHEALKTASRDQMADVKLLAEAQKLGLKDPDGLKLLPGERKFDKNGHLTNAEELVAQLAAEKKYLFEQVNHSTASAHTAPEATTEAVRTTFTAEELALPASRLFGSK